MAFFPEGAEVPIGLRTADLALRMLGPDVVEPDYEAIMESRERLRLWSNSSWPTDDFTLQDNLKDMHMHADEFMAKEAFAYTVLSADESRVEGCIYIMPLAGLMKRRRLVSSSGDNALSEGAASVGFWVRDSALERDLDRQLLTGLIGWFADEWPFEQMVFLTNESQERDHAILGEMGLPQVAVLQSNDSGVHWQLWDIPLR